MTTPIPPPVKTKPPSQLPRPERPIIGVRVAEALAKAMWEIDPDRIRQLSGLPELSDELIQHRIDMLLKAGVPWLFSEDGARKLRKRHRK